MFVKRKCQHAGDVADKSTWCEEVATVRTWCDDQHRIAVYQCEAHHDPTYQGWTIRGKVPTEASGEVERDPEGWSVPREMVYP